MSASPAESTTSAERPFTARVALILAPVLALMAWHAWSVYWQCDDAFISFRYVWHFVNGNGLVFNPGERVEGYTNFLWVLELSAIWKWFGVPPEIACNGLSTLATIGAVAVTVAMALRGPVQHRRVFTAFGALLLLATSRTWAVWCTSGLETRQFTLFTLLGVYLVGTGRGRPGRLALASVAFAGAEYTRPEGPLLWAFAGAWLLVEMAIARRFSLRDCLAYGVPLVVLVSAHFLWRHSYYDEWLPNTYYAKFVRPWPEAGLRYYAAGVIESGAWFLLPFAFVGAVSRARRGDRTHFLAAAVVGAHVYYLVQIGGDHFELRPLDFYWPLLMVAAVEGMLATGEAVAARWKSTPAPSTRRAWSVTAVLLGLGVFYGSVVQSAKIAYCLDPKYDTREASHFLFVKLDPDASWTTSLVPPMKPLVNAYNDLQAYCLKHGVGTVWREHAVFWRTELENWGPYLRVRGRGVMPPDAVDARGAIGIVGYCLADLRLVDQLGLADRYVAHKTYTEEQLSNDERYMAHDKKADLPYLWSRGVNIQTQPAAKTLHEALLRGAYALKLADDLWMPFLNPRPRTPEVSKAPWVDAAFVGRGQWRSVVDREVGCFRADVEHGWTIEGTAFAGGVRPNSLAWHTLEWPVRCGVDHALSSQDSNGEGGGTGRARSAFFRVSDSSILAVRIGGTAGASAGLRLVTSDGAVLAELHAKDPRFVLPVHVDLAPYAGREVAVELFDEADDAWVAVVDLVTLVPAPLDKP